MLTQSLRSSVALARTPFTAPIREFHQLRLSKSEKKAKNVEKKKKNIAFQNAVESKKEMVDPVLGKPNNAFINRLRLEIGEPNILSKGYDLVNVDKLLYGAKEVVLQNAKEKGDGTSLPEELAKREQQEIEKRDILLRILTLRNADNVEKQKKLRELTLKEFQRFEGDTGSPEVQAAIMTVEIFNLMDHIKKNPQDLLHIRKARMLTQQRQRILRYLKRSDPQKYFYTIEKLGLTDETVHMEFNMDRKYMDEFQIWPGRQLVKINKKENEEMKKKRRLEKQALKKALASKAAEAEAEASASA